MPKCPKCKDSRDQLELGSDFAGDFYYRDYKCERCGFKYSYKYKLKFVGKTDINGNSL